MEGKYVAADALHLLPRGTNHQFYMLQLTGLYGRLELMHAFPYYPR